MSGPKVAVVGGGIAGLSAAWEVLVRRPDAEVVVLEAAPRLGGKIATAEFAGRQVDLGADAFVARRPEGQALCGEIGLASDLVAPATRHARLLVDGTLRRLPEGSVLGLPTRLGPLLRSAVLTPAGVARAALDLMRPPLRNARGQRLPDTALGPLVDRRLGKEVTQRLAEPLIGGIHAGSVRTMSTAAVFPPLLDAAGRSGSLMRALRDSSAPRDPADALFLGVRGGMERLVGRLADALVGRGAVLRTSTGVDALEHRTAGAPWALHTPAGTLETDGVVLAVPAPHVAVLLGAHDQELARLLTSVRHASVVLVTMQLEAGAVGVALDGSGFLVPRGDSLMTACTWLSAKWPALARPDDVLVRVSAGRDGDERALALDDGALVRRLGAELAEAMALREGPRAAMVARFPRAFPQYDVGHLVRVEAIERAAAAFGGLALAGAALRGVGIPACIGSGRRAAGAVLEGLGAVGRAGP